MSLLSTDTDFCQQIFFDVCLCNIYALGLQFQAWPLNRLPDDSCQTPRTVNRTITEFGRTIIGRLFIGRLQRRVGRSSEDSIAGYFGKRYLVHARRLFGRCSARICFYPLLRS